MNLPTRLVQRTLHGGLHGVWRGAQRAGEIGPDSHRAREFAAFGAGTGIGFPYATLMNPRAIHLGSGTLIGRHVTLSVGYGPGDQPLPERALVIGDRCVVGARCSLTAHESIKLGDDVWLGQDVFVSDASHGYADPDTPIGRQLGEHRPVSVGSGTWIGHGAILLPGTRIGRNVVVAAGSVVRGEIPHHAVVAGVPAKVVRRFEPGLGWVNTREDDVRPIAAVDY